MRDKGREGYFFADGIRQKGQNKATHLIPHISYLKPPTSQFIVRSVCQSFNLFVSILYFSKLMRYSARLSESSSRAFL